MAQAELDTSQGWCCDGRTYKEHADADGECCQPQGKQIEDLPPEGQQKARERLGQASGESPGEIRPGRLVSLPRKCR
jgi:hypothetical protein